MRDAAVGIAAGGIAATEGCGGQPVGTKAIGMGRWWSRIVRVFVVDVYIMGRKSCPTESTRKNK